MSTASHYVFMDLDDMIKNKRYKKLSEISRRYSERYEKDQELQEVCFNIGKLIDLEDYESLVEMREDLEKLISARRLDYMGPLSRETSSDKFNGDLI